MLIQNIYSISMRIILFTLVVIFSFNSLSRADDLKNFEIEGISIGDSLLKHFKLEDINESKVNYNYKSQKYSVVEFTEDKSKSSIYDLIQIQFLTNDNKIKVKAISGVVFFKDINNCYNKLDQTYEEVYQMFSSWNSDGKAIYETKIGQATDYTLTNINRDIIQIACFDYFDDNKFNDHLRISIKSSDYADWLSKELYG